MLQRQAARASRLWNTGSLLRNPLFSARFKRYQAYDAELDREGLDEARSWFQSFSPELLPKGNTTYARSSGPGGQHVNKTETKAITTYSVTELVAILPRSLHSAIRKSKYYTVNSDSWTFQAQTSRSRNANAEDNRTKLVQEVTRIYHEAVPAETSEEKKKKHEAIRERFHETRVKQKKFNSAKKQGRRGPSD